MSRRPAAFRQLDVTRALRGTVAAGIEVQRIEIGPDGKIIVVTAKPAEAAADDGGNEWDRV
jgi:hypothetical protein